MAVCSCRARKVETVFTLTLIMFYFIIIFILVEKRKSEMETWPMNDLGKVGSRQSWSRKDLREMKSGKPSMETKTEERVTDDSTSETLEQVFEARRVRYESVCATQNLTRWQVNKDYVGIYEYSPAHLSLCKVPKVGATFWKRIFFFLHNATGRKMRKEKGRVHSPFDIDRLFVHRHGIGSRGTVNMWSAEGLNPRFSNSTRVMFSRDPWSRLWSAYVDKFVMPDSWLDYGRKILLMRNKLRANISASLKTQSKYERQANSKGNTSWLLNNNTTVTSERLCADDISFGEFLCFAVFVDNNRHWRPVHLVCNPCSFRPKYLGKLETFSRDSVYVLNVTGLGHLADQQSSKNHVLDELQLLTVYHFRLWRQRIKGFQGCLDSLGLARRLWSAFQLNGYIPIDYAFPAERLAQQLRNVNVSVAQDLFLNQLMKAHFSKPLSSAERSAFRRQVLVAAYRSVPRDLLAGVQKKFSLDFDLFGYDREPKDIFG